MQMPLNACCSTKLDFTGIRPTLGGALLAGAIYAATGILVVVIMLNAVL